MTRLLSSVVEEWTDEGTGFPCLVRQSPRRTFLGSGLCGYVGVGPEHPWYGRHYSEPDGLEMSDLVSVHGCVTFADSMDGFDDLWWIGFDTAHYDSGYWTADEVREECWRLARQLKAVAS